MAFVKMETDSGLCDVMGYCLRACVCGTIVSGSFQNTTRKEDVMLVHTVFFWLKPDLSQEKQQAFREGLESLRGIETVEVLYVGTPAPTPPRPVIDHSYSFGLTVVLKDMAAHDTYQVHHLHKAFLEKFAASWDRVLVYDAV
jgi:hypothetical protein